MVCSSFVSRRTPSIQIRSRAALPHNPHKPLSLDEISPLYSPDWHKIVFSYWRSAEMSTYFLPVFSWKNSIRSQACQHVIYRIYEKKTSGVLLKETIRMKLKGRSEYRVFEKICWIFTTLLLASHEPIYVRYDWNIFCRVRFY